MVGWWWVEKAYSMAGHRTQNRLTALAVEKQSRPGIYADGAGLNLVVTEHGVKRWELRISRGKRRRQLGLGLYPDVSLELARRTAHALRHDHPRGAQLPRGRRPASFAPIASGAPTFRNAFNDYFETKAQQLSNPKHAAQWRSTMDAYVFPQIGERQITDITAANIVDILKPIWNAKPETAKRVLQRMRVVFEAAIVRGDRQTAAPTTGIKTVLGARSRSVPKHHAALPFSEVPVFVAHVRHQPGLPATRLAFEFLILTAARSNEVRAATWDEIDLNAALWIVPGTRMKARAPHVVPLSDRALDILQAARTANPTSTLIFPGTKQGRPLSDMTMAKMLRSAGLGGRATAHGFRSSFKDWCAEIDKVRDDVSEAALAHKIANKVRAAYLRTQFLDERRGLMQRWTDYVGGVTLATIAERAVQAPSVNAARLAQSPLKGLG
jgi:integrase